MSDRKLLSLHLSPYTHTFPWNALYPRFLLRALLLTYVISTTHRLIHDDIFQSNTLVSLRHNFLSE